MKTDEAMSGRDAIPYHVYDALPGTRWSLLKWMRVSAKHFRYAEENWAAVGKDSKSKRLGRGLHAAVLEPDRFELDWVSWAGDRRTKAFKLFAHEQAGREILTEPEMNNIIGAARAIARHPVASHYLEKGVAEMSITWTDILVGAGMDCKARLDLVNGHVIDLKSTHAPKPAFFATVAANLGYPEQLAFYRMGLRANGIAVAPEAVLIAVEVEPPFDVVVYQVAEEVIDRAEEAVRDHLEKVAKCRASGVWPGISDTALDLAMPRWWFQEHEQRMDLWFDKVTSDIGDDFGDLLGRSDGEDDGL